MNSVENPVSVAIVCIKAVWKAALESSSSVTPVIVISPLTVYPSLGVGAPVGALVGAYV